MRQMFAAIPVLAWLALAPPSQASTIVITFTGHSDPNMIVNGTLNAAYNKNDFISGFIEFDDQVFTDLQTSYNAQQEYPDAETSFALTDGATYSHLVYTEPVVATTYYPDMLLTTNSASSSMNFYNLDSTYGFYATSFKYFSLSFGTEVETLADMLGAVSLGRFNYRCSVCNGQVSLFYVIDRFELASPVPEPATLLLLGTGLGAVAARRRLKKRA